MELKWLESEVRERGRRSRAALATCPSCRELVAASAKALLATAPSPVRDAAPRLPTPLLVPGGRVGR
ncbi:MAG: hypothetical protein QM765_38175 [Myxococcales bacterium]